MLVLPLAVTVVLRALMFSAAIVARLVIETIPTAHKARSGWRKETRSPSLPGVKKTYLLNSRFGTLLEMHAVETIQLSPE